MKNTLVVVAGLASYKAFRLHNNNHLKGSPHLELLEEHESAEAHEKMVDKVSDSAGQYRRGPGVTGSYDERHNTVLEVRKRLVRQLAEGVNRLAGKPEVERCLVAVSREINHMVMEELTPQVRAKIEQNLSSDLTKVERAELLKHFDGAVTKV